jgi:hypothetical protein
MGIVDLDYLYRMLRTIGNRAPRLQINVVNYRSQIISTFQINGYFAPDITKLKSYANACSGAAVRAHSQSSFFSLLQTLSDYTNASEMPPNPHHQKRTAPRYN